MKSASLLVSLISVGLLSACNGSPGFKSQSSDLSSLDVPNPPTGKTVQARVRVKDENGNFVSGVEIIAHWGGPNSPHVIANTDSNGYAVFTIPVSKSGPVHFTVDGMYKNYRFPYDRNLDRQVTASIVP